MKRITSLVLAGLFCFVGLNLTGCDAQRDEATVVESTAAANDTGGFDSQEQMDQYAAEMQKQMSQGQ